MNDIDNLKKEIKNIELKIKNSKSPADERKYRETVGNMYKKLKELESKK